MRTTCEMEHREGAPSSGLRGPAVDTTVLRQAPLFSALDDEAATALGSSMTETRLRRG
jgi:hypothetical protein